MEARCVFTWGLTTMAGSSHRASMAPAPGFRASARARMSMAPSAAASAVASARLSAKQAELAALQALRAETAELTSTLEQLSEHVDVLATGGQGM